LQLAEAAVDGAFGAAFVASQLGERVGAVAIPVEGTGDEVAFVGRGGRRRHRSAFRFGVTFFDGVLFLAGLVDCGDGADAFAVDAGFHGDGAVEAPLIGGNAEDQFFFGGADGLEAVEVVVDEDEEFGRILVEQDVIVRAQAVDEAIAAGCGFAFVGARARGFLGIASVSVDLGLGGSARFIGIFHIGGLRPRLAGLPPSC